MENREITGAAPRNGLGRALALVGDRWTLELVAALLEGPRRYGELSDAVPAIAPNILSRRLTHLERAGLLTSTPYSRRPVRLSYALTEPGRELAGVVAQLGAWAARVTGDESAEPHHGTCGSAVELRAWCPTCERLVDGGEVSELSWA